MYVKDRISLKECQWKGFFFCHSFSGMIKNSPSGIRLLSTSNPKKKVIQQRLFILSAFIYSTDLKELDYVYHFLFPRHSSPSTGGLLSQRSFEM